MPFDYYQLQKDRQLWDVPASLCRSELLDYKLANLAQRPHRRVISGHTARINSIALDKVEHRYLLSAGDDAQICLYDVAERLNQEPPGFVARSLSQEQPEEYEWQSSHDAAVRVVCWYASDTGMFVSAGADGKIGIWDTNELQAVVWFNFRTGDVLNSVNACAVSSFPQSGHIVAAGTTYNHNVRLCDIKTGAFTHMLLGHTDVITSVQWSLTSEFQLASGSADGTVRLWDIRKPGALTVLNQHDDVKQRLHAKSRVRATAHDNASHNGAVTGLQYSPDGLYLMSYGVDRRLHLWDLSTGKHTFKNFGFTQQAIRTNHNFCFSNDGRYVFSSSGSRQVRVHAVDSGECISTLRGHFDVPTSMDFNPITGDLFTAGADAAIIAWSDSPKGNVLM